MFKLKCIAFNLVLNDISSSLVFLFPFTIKYFTFLTDLFHDSDDSRDVNYKPSENEKSDFDPKSIEKTPPHQNLFSGSNDYESDPDIDSKH